MAKMIIDENSQPIPVLTPNHDTIANAAVTASSAATALPSGAKVVEIGLSTDAYFLFGTSGASVTSSTGQFMPKGTVVYGVPLGATHVAVIRSSADGRVTITELK